MAIPSTDSPSKQGALACSENISRSECPWQNGSLSAVEWHMGYIGTKTIMQRHAGENDTASVSELSGYITSRNNILKDAWEYCPKLESFTKIEIPLTEWYRNRKTVTEKILELNILDDMNEEFGSARIVKGAYTGPLSKDCPYGEIGPVKAIWIEFQNGITLDPFRWIMESTNPSIWIGNSDHYDENGARLRKIMSPESTKKENSTIIP